MDLQTIPWPNVLWLVLGLGLVVYAITGGADLGAGVWVLFAGGPRKAEQRRAVYDAIAPIWEANHVWLIFVIVLMFSAFSRAFAALSIALHIPMAIVLMGLVFRGSAYVFRAYGIQGEGARAGWERVFAWASLFTPLVLGLVVGGVSSGEIRVESGHVTTGFLAGWTSLFAFSVGAFSLALFAMLSAVYLAAETSGALGDDFRRRALVMEGVSGALAFGTFVLAHQQAPLLFTNLAHAAWSWPVQIGTAGLALTTIGLLLQERATFARYTAAAQVALVVIGWGLAMRGHFILPDVDLETASTNTSVMPALAIALGVGSLLLGPALFYLYKVFKRAHSPTQH